jgi:NAD(P)H-dependent FMN reductase
VSKLQIIIGSTRPTRAADRVAPWVIERAKTHGAFDVEVLDLRDWPLPMFGEHFGTIGDFKDPTYSDPIVKRWNQKIKEADAYLVVTPEYNHSVPGVLKNAIDNVFVSFAARNKPQAAVGYSGGLAGGVRAIEHLAQIAVEAEIVPLRSSVIIPQVAEAFDANGMPVNRLTDISLRVLLDDLAWWAAALKQARANGELQPASFRFQAAAAPIDEVEDEAV